MMRHTAPSSPPIGAADTRLPAAACDTTLRQVEAVSPGSVVPRAHAVALAYRTDLQAPQVIAKGSGLLAETIIEKARAAGIYVHPSPALVELLMKLDLDEQIPPSLYRAVAEILVFLYALEQATPDAPSPYPTGPVPAK